MSCDKCNSNNKNVNIKINIDGENHAIGWSDSQASQAGFHSVFENKDFPLSDLIASVLKKNLPASVETKDNPKCPNCGLTFLELLEIGRIGCAHCYAAFGNQMEILLDKIHGSAMHVGFVHERTESFDPIMNIEQTNKLESELSEEEKLKLELEEAIECEDYEKAARLRDLLKGIEAAS